MRTIGEQKKDRGALGHQYRQQAMTLLLDQVRRLGWRYLGFVLAMMTFGLAALLPAQLFHTFTNILSTENFEWRTFLWAVGGFGGLVAIALFLSTLASAYLKEWLRLEIESDLRRRVLQRLHQVPLQTLDGAQRGDWLTRMTGDLGQSEAFITESLPDQFRNAAILTGAASLFLYHSGTLGLVPLLTAIVIAVLNIIVQRKLAPILRDLRNLHGGIFHELIENLEGIRTIRSQKVEAYVQRRFDLKLNEITHKSMSVVKKLGFLLGSNSLLSQAMITLCLCAAAWGMTQGTLTLKEILFYPFFIGMFYGAAQGLAAATYDWNRFFNEGGRLGEILFGFYVPVDTAEWDLPVSKVNKLEVNSLCFGPQAISLMKDLDFQIQRGSIHTIMGPSGCGKSTFLEVLAGLRPAHSGYFKVSDGDGELLINHRLSGAGLPINLCAYVEQHPYIFEATLRENLIFGNPDRLSDAVIWETLEQASLYHFVRSRGGLDHFLSDRGRNLSEGERYRIALCRALLLGRPFLLLDEPFASLDAVSITLISKTLAELKKSTGIVVVTHYLPEGYEAEKLTKFGEPPEPPPEKKIDLSGNANFSFDNGVSLSLNEVRKDGPRGTI